MLPQAIGVGFKPKHYDGLLQEAGVVRWLEVHAENYMGAGGEPRAQLAALAEKMPVSVHGVGLSLGGSDLPDNAHLMRLRDLCDRVKPAQLSEHIAWAGLPGQFANDLLPVDYSAGGLNRLVINVDHAQQVLGRTLLLENPSHYLVFAGLAYDSPAIETDFLAALVEQTGCGLLLDVNNVHVTCFNLGWSARAYLDGFPFAAVGEIHLAGHSEDSDVSGMAVLIDNHGAPVAEPVWHLYEYVLGRCGARPTLIEWDTHVPDWSVLLAEAGKADAILQAVCEQEKVA